MTLMSRFRVTILVVAELLVGCTPMITDAKPTMESDDVFVKDLPSTGILDVTMQSVVIKSNVLNSKTIEQVMVDICSDFKWFQPYTILHLYEENFTNQYSSPRYIYYPEYGKSLAFIVDKKNDRKYILKASWCDANHAK